MTIATWKAKPTTVRVAGPWDGSPEKSADLAELLGKDSQGGNNWEPGNSEYQAEYWDDWLSRWVTVHRGQCLARHSSGRIRILGEGELEELYEPAETETEKK